LIKLKKQEQNFNLAILAYSKQISMNSFDRITVDPSIMLGKPVIKGTRITVELILKTLSEGATTNDLLEMYPHLIKEDINAALQYASSVMAVEETITF
jgi:uncharacterized protein (DUF433 family)